MRPIGILVVFGILAVVPAPSATACSVVGPVITDSGLTRASDAVVRARAEAYAEPPCPPDVECADRLGRIRFRVVEVLKGPFPSPLFHAWGRLDDQEAQREAGICHSTAYKPDTEFLLFLNNWSGIWVVSTVPLAPTNREVKGENDPRVLGVRAEVKRMKQESKPRKSAQ